MEQSAPKTCLPQPELEGLPSPQGAAVNPTGAGSCRAWWYVPKWRGFAALGSLILEGLPHALPEGDGYRQLCASKSLGVHGEAKERKTGYLTQEFPGGTEFQIPTMFFQQCKCPHAPCYLQAIQMSSHTACHMTQRNSAYYPAYICTSNWSFVFKKSQQPCSKN